jgi:hypothetical protein
MFRDHPHLKGITMWPFRFSDLMLKLDSKTPYERTGLSTQWVKEDRITLREFQHLITKHKLSAEQ